MIDLYFEARAVKVEGVKHSELTEREAEVYADWFVGGSTYNGYNFMETAEKWGVPAFLRRQAE